MPLDGHDMAKPKNSQTYSGFRDQNGMRNGGEYCDTDTHDTWPSYCPIPGIPKCPSSVK